jgi:hypothetical protein
MPEQIARLKVETQALPTTAVDYSVHQRVCPNPQFRGSAMAELAAHPAMLAFLGQIFGGEIVLMSYAYARSEPGHPGISLHTDGQPTARRSSATRELPALVRVLLSDDLTRDISPFRVIPTAPVAHADGNPHQRFAAHPKK